MNDIEIFSIFGRKKDIPKIVRKMPTYRQGVSKIHNPKFFQDPRFELLDRQSPQSETKFAADPRSAVFSKSANPFNFPLNSAIRSLFKAKSVDPRTYSPPSVKFNQFNSQFNQFKFQAIQSSIVVI